MSTETSDFAERVRVNQQKLTAESSHFGPSPSSNRPRPAPSMDGTASLANRDFGGVEHESVAFIGGKWFSPMPRIMQMRPQARAISPFWTGESAETGLGGGAEWIRTVGTALYASLGEQSVLTAKHAWN
jgi:hypothetical protein